LFLIKNPERIDAFTENDILKAIGLTDVSSEQNVKNLLNPRDYEYLESIVSG
jgi:hypothetical protein